MAEDVQETLSKMKIKELRAFAKHNEIDIKGRKTKKDIIEAIASHDGIEGLLDMDEPGEEEVIEEEEQSLPPDEEVQVFGGPEDFVFDEDDVRDRLSGLKVAELKALASRHDVDISECRRKKDYLDVLSANENAYLFPDDIDALQKEKDLERIRDELVDVGVGIEETIEEAKAVPSMSDRDADRLLLQARNIDVDFNDVEDLLDFARMRFEEENFDKAVELSGEAIRVARSRFQDLLRLALAYQIMSNEKLLNRMSKSGRDFSEPVSLLIRSKEAYKKDRFEENVELMNDLAVAIRSMYSDDIKKTRDSLYRTGEFLSEISNLGADLTVARDLLHRARDAARRNDNMEAGRLMERSVEVALEAKEKRMHEIKEMIPTTEALIEEAKNLGADVSDAEKMLMQGKIALDNDDYILCAELAGRAQGRAGEIQHKQIQKAMDLREKQLKGARRQIEQLYTVLSEADSYKLNVSKAKRLLYVARETIKEHDFVRMNRYVARAQKATDSLMPAIVIERKKRGIEKPRAGICGNCRSRKLQFHDIGFGECKNCGKAFTWVTPPDKNVWQKLRSFFWE